MIAIVQGVTINKTLVSFIGFFFPKFTIKNGKKNIKYEILVFKESGPFISRLHLVRDFIPKFRKIRTKRLIL